MLDVNIKFGRRALPIVSQVRDAGYVVPEANGVLQIMQNASSAIDALYERRILDAQDRDAARVRIEAKVRKLRLNKR